MPLNPPTLHDIVQHLQETDLNYDKEVLKVSQEELKQGLRVTYIVVMLNIV